MTTVQIALIMLSIFGVLVLIRVPMGIALGLSSIVGVILLPALGLSMVGQTAFTAVQSYVLIAIPLYIFAGKVMSEGGIAKKLVDLAGVFVKHIAGGLAMVEVVACAFFAAISGSSTATTVAIGSIMTPGLEEKGYDKSFVLAVAAAGGVIGPIIPPSIGMILYAVVTGASVADLFLGGVLPGILMMLFLLPVIYVIAKKRGYKGEIGEAVSISSFGKAIWNAKWALLTPVIIMGGIYGGIFTPTEAGAVVSVYAVLISTLIEKRLTFIRIGGLFKESCLMSTKILFLVGIATIFGRVMTMGQIPQMLAKSITLVSSNKFIAMLLINIFLLFVGCIMEGSAAVLILSPILLPVAEYFGYSTVHFGVILVTNLAIGAITPPIGCCLFAASAMGNEKIDKISKEALPFLAAYIGVLLVEIYFEPIVMALPRFFG